MDARKGEVYAAFFRESNGRLERMGNEQVGAPEAILRVIGSPHLVVGDAVEIYEERIRAIAGDYAVLAPRDLHFPRASVVARLARNSLQAASRDGQGRVVPHYIRQSDAELRIKRVDPTEG